MPKQPKPNSTPGKKPAASSAKVRPKLKPQRHIHGEPSEQVRRR
jgi:hypothetical protein